MIDAPALSDKEVRVLTLVVQGKQDHEAAEIIGISTSTVKFHLHRAYRTLGINSRHQLMARVLRDRDLRVRLGA